MRKLLFLILLVGSCQQAMASGIYNPGSSGGGGSGIVSPGTFTWTNSFGISASTITVTTATIQNINTTWIGQGRNRVLNGDFFYDHPNSYAQINPASLALATYVPMADYWQVKVGSGTYEVIRTQVQQTGGPGPLVPYLQTQCTNACTAVNANSYSVIRQQIPQQNIRDMQFGTAGAKTLTLSFWFNPTGNTGTYGGSVCNGAENRCFPFFWTIGTSAWTYITIAIPGDTSGTWTTTGQTSGMEVFFDMDSKSTYLSSSTGTWTSSFVVGYTGDTGWGPGGTAIVDLAGVQLEIGTQATPYEALPNMRIIGSPTSDTASTGTVGEYIESVISANTNFPTSGQYGDLTSLSLTAGDWDVSLVGDGDYNGTSASASYTVGISVTSGNSSSGLVSGSNAVELAFPNAATGTAGVAIPNYRISLATTTTVYYKYEGSYSGGPPRLKGRLSARRMR